MKYEFGNIKLNIDLPYGAYSPWSESAAGKTRFKNLIDSGIAAGEIKDAKTFTYDKNIPDSVIIDTILNPSINLIVLDRFDKYSNINIIKAINSVRENKYIILDVKNEKNARGLGYIDCDIEMKNPMEVRFYDGDDI